MCPARNPLSSTKRTTSIDTSFSDITGLDLSVLALSIVKQGENDLPGLTDTVVPKRLGPKRATKIRRFFGLSKEDDVSYLIASSPILLRIAD